MKWIYTLVILGLCTNVHGQRIHFIDQLFEVNLSTAQQQQVALKHAEIAAVKRNLGFSFQTRISNSVLDESLTGGTSTIASTKLDLIRNGLIANQMELDALRSELELERIKPNQEALNHNTGLYYDYIIHCYNQEKSKLATSISRTADQLNQEYKQLYHQKILDYDVIIELQKTRTQFQVLEQNHLSYNNTLAKVIELDSMPDLQTVEPPLVQFQEIIMVLEADTNRNQMVSLESQIIDNNYRRNNLPSFSISLGYDISRKRPYYGIGFSTRIKGGDRNTKKIHKEIIANRYQMQLVQKQKELLNIQHEFEYKVKQISGLQYDLNKIRLKQNQLKVKRTILGLEASLEEQHLSLDSLLLEYEILDLQQQCMLQLLQVKRQIFPFNISDFISPPAIATNFSKYPTTRYCLIAQETTLSELEKLILEQNELIPILDEDFNQLEGYYEINPDEFGNRLEMERFIAAHYSKQNNTNYLITDFQAFRDLELRSIQTKN